MKLPDDVRRTLAGRFQNKHREWLVGEVTDNQWPIKVPLGAPTEQVALRQVDGVRAWVVAWQRWQGSGRLSWADRRWKALGVQQLPECLILEGPQDVAAWIGESARWELARSRYSSLVAEWPSLGLHLPRHFDVLADYSDGDFWRLTEVLKWIVLNPRSNLYPRQIPVAGLDSKWLDGRKVLIANLVAAVQDYPAGETDFFRRCGLKGLPQLLRMRVLDPALRKVLGALGDISAPWEEVASLSIQPKYVFIVENLQTGLAFDDLPGAVVIMRLGYAVDVLSRIPWVQQAKCIYWGDVDTHGFSILHRARKYLPRLESMMMDETTLLAHRDLCVEETDQHPATELPLLSPVEHQLYLALKNNSIGQQIRLEQERIRWDFAWTVIETIILREYDKSDDSDGRQAAL